MMFIIHHAMLEGYISKQSFQKFRGLYIKAIFLKVSWNFWEDCYELFWKIAYIIYHNTSNSSQKFLAIFLKTNRTIQHVESWTDTIYDLVIWTVSLAFRLNLKYFKTTELWSRSLIGSIFYLLFVLIPSLDWFSTFSQLNTIFYYIIGSFESFSTD